MLGANNTWTYFIGTIQTYITNFVSNGASSGFGFGGQHLVGIQFVLESVIGVAFPILIAIIAIKTARRIFKKFSR